MTPREQQRRRERDFYAWLRDIIEKEIIGLRDRVSKLEEENARLKYQLLISPERDCETKELEEEIDRLREWKMGAINFYPDLARMTVSSTEL